MLTARYPAPESTASSWFDLSPETVIPTIWRGRTRVMAAGIVGAIIGVLIALLTPAEFVSEAKIMPEMGSGSGEMFKRLASVAGFSGMNVGDDEDVDAVRPDLYPTVLQSTPFSLYLIEQPITTATGQRMTVGQFLLPAEEPVWSMSRLFSLTKPDEARRPSRAERTGPMQLTLWQRDLVEDISERVSSRLDTRSGVITITAKMPDAHVSAMVAQWAMDYLTNYVTTYRTEKARQDLGFYQHRLREARQRYQTAQFSLFHYNDQHKSFVVQAATMEKQRREAELTIAQTVYTELSRLFEQAKLKVQEQTPVFKVLEPAQVPLERVSPKRTLIVLFAALAGCVLSILYLLMRQSNVVSRVRAMVKVNHEPSA